MAYTKYKWRYGISYNWTETAQYIIGTSSSLTVSNIEVHNDTNCAYVGWSGNDITGDGSYASPYRTIQTALDNLDSNQIIITLIDSNYYYTGDAVDLYLSIHGITLQGIEGESPTLTIDPTIANQVKMIQLAYDGKLVNVNVIIPESYSEQILGIDAQSGEIRYVTIDGANDNGIEKTTTGTIDLNYSIIKNSINDGETDGSGITISQGVMDIQYCQINDNDYCGIIFTGTGSKTVTVNYCTITGNQYGIYTTGCSNLDLTITNSINYKNVIYDHEGNYGIYSYSCLGKANGTPTLSSSSPMLRTDPLFISTTNFNLRSIYNGYGNSFISSPCLEQSSTGNDLGCFQYNRVLASQTFTEFETDRPLTFRYSITPVDAKLYITEILKPRISTKGDSEQIECAWTGNDNVLSEEQFDNVKTMRESSGNVFVSIDGGTSYTEYLIDKSRAFSYEKGINTQDNDVYKNIRLYLIKV